MADHRPRQESARVREGQARHVVTRPASPLPPERDHRGPLARARRTNRSSRPLGSHAVIRRISAPGPRAHREAPAARLPRAPLHHHTGRRPRPGPAPCADRRWLSRSRNASACSPPPSVAKGPILHGQARGSRIIDQNERALEEDFPNLQSLVHRLLALSDRPTVAAILLRLLSSFPGLVQRLTCWMSPVNSARGDSSRRARRWGLRSAGTLPVRSASKSSRSVSAVLKLALAAVLARRRKSGRLGFRGC